MVSFVYPSFLWALGLLSIPVIVHLFNFRRTKTVYFSNIRLLRVVQQTSRQQRNLRHLLVLLSRLLFLFFLVMAFAQPYLPASEQISSGKHVAVYLDNSLSMSVPMPDNSRAIDHGSAMVQSITEQFPPDTRYRLLTNDYSSSARSYRTGVQLRDQVAAVRLASAQHDMAEVARRVKDDFRPEVFLVSDFQRSAFPDLEQILLADSTLNWSILPIQSKPSSNVFVDSAAFENPFLIRGERGKLQVWVRNDGRTAVDHLVLRLTTGSGSGPEILSATATIALAPQATEVVSFDVVAGDRPISMKISLQDFPVTFDNEFYLTYMPLRRLRVVHLIEGDKQPYLQQVFGSKELFDYTSYSVKAIGYDAMEQADLIILDGLFAADQALVQFARTHPETVWMLVPPVPSGKPEQLRAMSDLSGLEVKPTATSGKPVPEALAPPAAGDPFFRNVFEESAGSSTPLRMPSAFPAVSWGADRSAILRFRDGTPFLSKIGNRYLFACPLNAAYTDLGSHALFVPLMYRMAATARQVEHALYYGSQARQVWLPGDSVGAELPVRLAGPRETVAPQRLVNGRVRLDLPEQAMMPGIYTALRGQDTLALLAFNADARESLQDRYALDELRAISAKQPKVRIFEPGDLQAFRDEIKARYLGTPLWKYAIWAALFFLLTEILLLRTPSELRKQAGTSA